MTGRKGLQDVILWRLVGRAFGSRLFSLHHLGLRLFTLRLFSPRLFYLRLFSLHLFSLGLLAGFDLAWRGIGDSRRRLFALWPFFDGGRCRGNRLERQCRLRSGLRLAECCRHDRPLTDLSVRGRRLSGDRRLGFLLWLLWLLLLLLRAARRFAAFAYGLARHRRQAL